MSKKLEKLLKQEKQLKAQIQLAQAAERTKEKKKETRRRILIGSAIMAQVEAGEYPEQKLRTLMDSFLTRPNERELFGLTTSQPPQPSPEPKEAVSTDKKAPTTKKTRTTRKSTDKKEPAAKKRRQQGK